jgi:hypothetical protein
LKKEQVADGGENKMSGKNVCDWRCEVKVVDLLFEFGRGHLTEATGTGIDKIRNDALLGRDARNV